MTLLTVLPNTSSDTSLTQDHSLMWIKIQSIEVETIIGIWPHERQNPQPLVIDLELGIQVQNWLATALTGELQRSIDYSEVSQTVAQLIRLGRFRLLESLVYMLAYFLFSKNDLDHNSLKLSPDLEKIRINVAKPQALISLNLGNAIPQITCELTRTQFRQTHELSEDQTEDLSNSIQPKVSRFDRPEFDNQEINTRVILDLDEVTITHVRSHQAGSFSLQPSEEILVLEGSLSCDYSMVSWMEMVSFLHFIHHD